MTASLTLAVGRCPIKRPFERKSGTPVRSEGAERRFPRHNSPRIAMSNERRVENHVRAVIELGSGRGNPTGDTMDGIVRATGHTQKELKSVPAKRLTALQVASFGISSVGTMQGGTAQRRVRGPTPRSPTYMKCYTVFVWRCKGSSPFSFLLDSSSPVVLLRLAADVSLIAADLTAPLVRPSRQLAARAPVTVP